MPAKGMHQSEESKLRNREKHLGKKASDTTKIKMSESQKKRFEDPNEVLKVTKHLIGNKINLGRIQTEEHRKKLSEAAKKKPPMSEETKKKIGDSNRKKHTSNIVFHHTKYKEIHGVDEGYWITASDHKKIHMRLRKEKKCNINPDDLRKFSGRANKERQTLWKQQESIS